MKKLLFIIATLFTFSVLQAETHFGTCGNNLTWVLDTETRTLEISGTGDMYSYDNRSAPWKDYYSRIGKIIINDGVTSIGERAFYNCSNLWQISIAGTVTHIHSSAFLYCTSLSTLKLEDSEKPLYLSSMETIYKYDRGTFADSPIRSLYIGRDITLYAGKDYKGYRIWPPFSNFGEGKLNNHSTQVTFGTHVTKIPEKFFKDVNFMYNLTLPDSLTEIGKFAFTNTTLTSIKIPSKVLEISDSAFFNCTNLKSVILPNELKAIKNGAFQNCQLDSICLSDSVKEIGKYAFYGNKFNSFRFPKAINKIEPFTFSECNKLKFVVFPLFIDSIAESAFENCDSLMLNKNLDQVTYIGKSAFSGCTSLNKLWIPNVTDLDTSTISGCKSLDSINIVNVKKLSHGMFANMKYLKHLELPFGGAGTAQTVGNFGELFGTEQNSDMRAVTQPLEDGTTKTYYLPTGLNVLVIGEGCEQLPYGALYNCSMIEKLTLPTTIKGVKENALYGCDGLTDIYVKRALPPSAYETSFTGVNQFGCTLHVPYNSKQYYSIANGWKYFYFIEEAAPLRISVAKSIEHAGEILGINEYQPGQVAEVEAVAHSGYTFVGWYENGNLLTTDSKYTVMVTDSHSLVAMFAPVLNGNNVVVVPQNSNVTLSWAQEIGATYYNVDIYSNAAMTMPVGSLVVDNTGKPVPSSASTEVSATIEGLSEMQNYYYSITVYGAEETILSKYTGSFSTNAGVEGVMGDTNAVEMARYDIHGRLLSAPVKGINIVKMSDGSTRKEIVK